MKVINRRGSYQQAPASSPKKAEGKKRKSPCTPYREKGKGKESKPSAFGTCLFAGAGARVRGALLRRHVNAAVEDALKAFCGTRGPAPSDEALWAKFAWRFGYEKLTDLVRQGVSEMSVPGRHVAPAERPKILQKTLRLVVKNGKNRRESIAEMAMRHRVEIEVAKMRYWGHMKKISLFFEAQ